MPNMSNTGLTLNILEIIASKQDVNIYKTTFRDNFLQSLRKGNLDYHFFRDGHYIYAWALNEKISAPLPSGFELCNISQRNNTLVFNKIIESGIVRWFKNNGSTIYPIKYSSIWEVEYKRDIANFKGLKVIPVLHFSIHPFYSVHADKIIAALSLRNTTKQEFIATELDFVQLSFDTRNLKRYKDGRIIANSSSVAKFLTATGQSTQFNAYRNDTNNEEYIFEKLIQTIDTFNKHIRENVYLPDSLKITSFNFHNLPNSNFTSERINKPNYYFYQERLGAGKFYNDLTKELKPYSYDLFHNKELKILVLTPDTHQGTTEVFIKQLEQRLKKVFHLDNLAFHYLPFDSKLKTYESALNNADCRGYDLAIVSVTSYDKNIQVNQSPYYITKAKLLNERIPTQEVTVEVMRRADNMIYEAIALNIYSKIGGMAWVIERVEKAKLEIVIGISSTINFDNQRIIGFANIFDFNGKYLIGDCSIISTFDNYSDNLEKYLTISISNLIQARGIQKEEDIRLIFHLSKEASKKYEIHAIESTLKKFKGYNIQFGIVHLSYNHNLRMFQNSGKKAPDRGTFVQLSTFQGLIHLGSYTKIPIYVRLDQRSTYRDLFDATKQVIYFCHLCYRSFRPANVPVTIKYPTLMARLTDDLCRIPRWDTSQLNRIKDKLWFI